MPGGRSAVFTDALKISPRISQFLARQVVIDNVASTSDRSSQCAKFKNAPSQPASTYERLPTSDFY